MDRWLTFDCFGTLIDWRHGIRTTGELLFPGHGPAFLDAYIALEAEVVRTRDVAEAPARELVAAVAGDVAEDLVGVGDPQVVLEHQGADGAFVEDLAEALLGLAQRLAGTGNRLVGWLWLLNI